MKGKSVQIISDVYCHHPEDDTRYRLFVNGELFTERTWIWRDTYLEEIAVITGKPGRYEVVYQLVSPTQSELEIRNMRLGPDSSPATLDGNVVEILP
jgi:hypothetical protein